MHPYDGVDEVEAEDRTNYIKHALKIFHTTAFSLSLFACDEIGICCLIELLPADDDAAVARVRCVFVRAHEHTQTHLWNNSVNSISTEQLQNTFG